jgi:protein O-mannosyl-transferase
LLAALGAGTLVALIRRKPVGLLGAWFFLILAPSSSIVPIATEVAAEHRMYLPLAAVAAAVVLGLQIFHSGFLFSGRKTDEMLSNSVQNRPEKRNPEWISIVGLAGVVVALAVATHHRNRMYASAEAIAADTVNGRPQNAQAQLTYGSYLVGEKRFVEAEPHLRAALALPLSPSTDESKARSLAHLYLGMALIGQNKPDDGSRELERAIADRADLDRAYPALAEAQLSQRQAGAAVATLNRALARRPGDVVLLKRAAWVLATSSDPAVRNAGRAVQYAERAVALTSSQDPVALDVLAAAHAEAGEFDQALAALTKAVGLVRANGPNELVPLLRNHLELFEARRPVRTPDW